MNTINQALIIAGLTTIFLFTSTSTMADPISDAQAAYDRGDYATALRLYKALAERGSARAENSLAVLYFKGQGVSEDEKIAVRWLFKAANDGNSDAQANLGVMYAMGSALPVDYSEALKWLRQSSAAGNSRAMLNLGALYEHGWGTQQDYSEAARWYAKSAALGYDTAKGALESLQERGLAPAAGAQTATASSEPGSATSDSSPSVSYATEQAAQYSPELIHEKCADYKEYIHVLFANTAVKRDLSYDPAVNKLKSDVFFKPLSYKDPLSENNISVHHAMALGDVLFCGRNRLFLESIGEKLYQYAALKGDVRAMDILGNMNDAPTALFHDALYWANKAATLGDPTGRYEYARDLEMIEDGEILKNFSGLNLEMRPDGELIDHKKWSTSNPEFLASSAKSGFEDVLKILGFYKVFPNYDRASVMAAAEAQYKQIAQTTTPFKPQAVAALARMHTAQSDLAAANAAVARQKQRERVAQLQEEAAERQREAAAAHTKEVGRQKRKEVGDRVCFTDGEGFVERVTNKKIQVRIRGGYNPFSMRRDNDELTWMNYNEAWPCD